MVGLDRARRRDLHDVFGLLDLRVWGGRWMVMMERSWDGMGSYTYTHERTGLRTVDTMEGLRGI